MLGAEAVGRLTRFGRFARYAQGETIYAAGQVGPGMVIVLSGTVCVMRRDGLRHATFIATQGPGQFVQKSANCRASRRWWTR